MPLNAGDRHQPDSQQDRQRQQDHVVQVTEDRDEVGDQVDGLGIYQFRITLQS
jgi:hypothetical protein